GLGHPRRVAVLAQGLRREARARERAAADLRRATDLAGLAGAQGLPLEAGGPDPQAPQGGRAAGLSREITQARRSTSSIVIANGERLRRSSSRTSFARAERIAQRGVHVRVPERLAQRQRA